jgi:hypothetical protein
MAFIQSPCHASELHSVTSAFCGPIFAVSRSRHSADRASLAGWGPLPANLDLGSSPERLNNRMDDDRQAETERDHDRGHKPAFYFLYHL